MVQLRGHDFATLEWIDWFNDRRLLEPIGNIPPAEAEQRYYLARARPDSAKTVHRRRRESVVEGIRRTFGPAAAIQRCQIHKARKITEHLPKEHHAATCRVLRQAWELDANKPEKLIRNLARRLDQQWPGVTAGILEGVEEILTVVRLKLPTELRRSLASTDIAENMMGTIAASRATLNVGGMPAWRCDGPRPA